MQLSHCMPNALLHLQVFLICPYDSKRDLYNIIFFKYLYGLLILNTLIVS